MRLLSISTASPSAMRNRVVVHGSIQAVVSAIYAQHSYTPCTVSAPHYTGVVNGCRGHEMTLQHRAADVRASPVSTGILPGWSVISDAEW
jgi:hypothetical protein